MGLFLIGCGADGQRDATPSAEPTATRAAAAYLTPPPAIQPIVFPDDEAPHDVLTEWWYYTGHLFVPGGERYGFEFVFFQARRGAFPPVYAAHFAITDTVKGSFTYEQRIGPNAIVPADEGFSLRLDEWTMSGANGVDQLSAAMDCYAIELTLRSEKPPVLHNEVGYIEVGEAGGSYYYSRTRMSVEGSLAVDGSPVTVTGQAWMDHQWGNFITGGAGGWDWFAVQLDNQHELIVYQIRDLDQRIVMEYGTLVYPDGQSLHLEDADIELTVNDEWTSPRTGAVYPIDWTVLVPNEEIRLEIVPVLQDQELDTSQSTGVIYWEGAVEVEGLFAGATTSGLGYVELTGYDTGPQPNADSSTPIN